MISRRGLLETSRTLDQVGVFARSLEDAASLSDVLSGYDPADCMSFLRARPSALTGARDEPPVEPNLVWFELPFADRLSPASREGLAEGAEIAGPAIVEESGATTVLPPGWRARVLPLGHLALQREEG